MGFANLCFRRSASRLASSVCGGRVRSISTVVNRPSLVHNPSPLRPFVSRGFLYSTAAIDDDWVSSEQAVLRAIDYEYNYPIELVDGDGRCVSVIDQLARFAMALWKDRSLGMKNPPASFPFKIEDIPGNRTVKLTREHNGEHIEVVSAIPFVVTVTKKSGRSLELRCTARALSDEIIIDAIHVNLPGKDPEVLQDIDDSVGIDHEVLKKTFNKYLEIRGLNASTIYTIDRYMMNKMKLEYWLWLDHLKEFLEE
ncbi:PREDICTED: uncharacterized protein At2g39795, mitochondrial-like [Camelina sativa]|uniref:Uncharacterized protein At2g39795, mitochondrial-like n=1 Tax=Camelina sativa TaxID=90675 RepID=A0ABM0YY38_CAMSA|nr:PREDICTED: uncharacterized protein At2g39795, mitochondrial-like [Camelina sativa]